MIAWGSQIAQVHHPEPGLFQNRNGGRSDFLGMALEDTAQKSNSPIEDFFRTMPMRLGCTEMDRKLSPELQGIPVHCVVLFFEGHVFKVLGNSFVPSGICHRFVFE